MNFTKELYPYQRVDVDKMKSLPKCLNRNPMGLGKTIEALALCHDLDMQHVLIVCKKSLVGEWFWQTESVLGEGALTPHDNGQYDHRLAGLDLKAPRFVAVNYDLIAIPQYRSILTAVPWDLVIFDEAHRLKNYSSKRTLGAYALTYRVPRALFLTGTPIRNTPLDLFPLFHMMNPREYTSWKRWRDWFCVTEREEIWLKNPYTGKPAPRYITKILPGTKNEEQLAQLLTLYSVYNEKSEVMPQLPPKQYRTIPVELGPEKKQYETMQEEYFALLDSGVEITAQVAVAQMMRLRQICLDPNTLLPEPPRSSTPSNKTLALLDVIDETDGKIVVFTFFERYVQILTQEFDKAGINYRIITGKSKGALKAELDFQNDPAVKVILGTIGAMGEGFTLTSADVVVFTDSFWTPAVIEQCEDRVHGRVDKGLESIKNTLVIDLFCPGTVEEHVRAVKGIKERMITEIESLARVVDRMRKASRRLR